MRLATPLLTSQGTGQDTTITLDLTVPRNFVLSNLLERGIIAPDDWNALEERARRRCEDTGTVSELLDRLLDTRLLTLYQASQVRANETRDLIIGNYRILEQIGSGGMGQVFRGEHLLLRRQIAIKVLHASPDSAEILLQRFFVEMRALARIHHPNIAWALDAGTVEAQGLDEQSRHYLVMEYIPGGSLEQRAHRNPMSVAQACEVIYQLAGALVETHKHNLIHRDIKPSNILVTPNGTAKLLDFGLALHFGRRRLTMPGTLLGTLGYMAPEQVGDAANVDIRADIFGLGATLFFMLTGECPFPTQGSISHQASARMKQHSLDVRTKRPEVSAELSTTIQRMMAHRREDRYPTPQALLRAMLPFVNGSNRGTPVRPPSDPGASAGGAEREQVDAAPRASVCCPPPASRILIVDDEEGIRELCRLFLQSESYLIREADNGEDALKLLTESEFDLVLLDFFMPRMSGPETLERLRQSAACRHVKVIMMSGGVSPEEMSEMLALGADDYVVKPFTSKQLASRVKSALAHGAIQDRADQLKQQLMQVNTDLERVLNERDSDLCQVRKTLLYTFARIVESRTQETSGHLARMARYATTLARHARDVSRSALPIDDAFIQTLEACTPLHDLGNVAMPDHILRHTGPPSAEDCIVMQAHTTIGAETLATIAKRDRSAAAFWQMAIDVARHHHEHHDGTGYPDRLAGRDIPLAARIVAVADAYDTLRRPSEGGASLSHNAAVEMIIQGSKGRFDPMLLQALQQAEREFDVIFRTCPDGAHDA